MLLVTLSRGGGVIETPYITLAEDLERSGVRCWIRLWLIAVTVTHLFLVLPGRWLTS